MVSWSACVMACRCSQRRTVPAIARASAWGDRRATTALTVSVVSGAAPAAAARRAAGGGRRELELELLRVAQRDMDHRIAAGGDDALGQLHHRDFPTAKRDAVPDGEAGEAVRDHLETAPRYGTPFRDARRPPGRPGS